MSTDIYAMPDLTRKVRYNRGADEDREERTVAIYESADDYLGTQKATTQNATRSQDGGPHTEMHLPALQRIPSKAAVGLGLLCLLLVAVILGLAINYVSVIEVGHKLMMERDQLNISHNQLQTSFHNLTEERNQLQTSNHNLTQERNQLQTSFHNLTKERNQLQTSYHNLEEERNQLQTRFNILSKNNSQLVTEADQLERKLAGKSCPEGWMRFGCSCYYKSTEAYTWQYSRKDCQSRESDLVAINSREEQEYVYKLNGKREFWIGLHNIRNERTKTQVWEWVDRSPLTETSWARNHPTYSSCPVYNNGQGQWTQTCYNYSYKNWICEKKISE